MLGKKGGWRTAFGSGPVAESKGPFCGLKLPWMAISLQFIRNLTMRWHLSIKKWILNVTLSKGLIFDFNLEMVVALFLATIHSIREFQQNLMCLTGECWCILSKFVFFLKNFPSTTAIHLIFIFLVIREPLMCIARWLSLLEKTVRVSRRCYRPLATAAAFIYGGGSAGLDFNIIHMRPNFIKQFRLSGPKIPFLALFLLLNPNKYLQDL